MNRLKSLSIVVLLFLFCTVSISYGATVIKDGAYIYPSNWTAEGSPYIIMGEATVGPDITLEIHPGTVIKAGDSPHLKKIRVQGQINAIGTPEEMITFISPEDGGVLSGIIFEARELEGKSVFRYCNLTGLGVFGFHTTGQTVEIEYCRIDSSKSLNTFNLGRDAKVKISNCLFMDGSIHCQAGSLLEFRQNLAIAKFTGIELRDQSKAVIRNNTIVVADTVLYAMKVQGDVVADISSNNIVCSRYAIKSEKPFVLGPNWWGEASPDAEMFAGKVINRINERAALDLDFVWTHIEEVGDDADMQRIGTYIIDPAKVIGRVEDEE